MPCWLETPFYYGCEIMFNVYTNVIICKVIFNVQIIHTYKLEGRIDNHYMWFLLKPLSVSYFGQNHEKCDDI